MGAQTSAFNCKHILCEPLNSLGSLLWVNNFNCCCFFFFTSKPQIFFFLYIFLINFSKMSSSLFITQSRITSLSGQCESIFDYCFHHFLPGVFYFLCLLILYFCLSSFIQRGEGIVDLYNLGAGLRPGCVSSLEE